MSNVKNSTMKSRQLAKPMLLLRNIKYKNAGEAEED